MITDLDLCIDIQHTRVGDLVVTITHVDTGASAVIADRPGVPATTHGCSGQDIFVYLDDQASSQAENQCARATPTIYGSFKPNNPLSIFNGEDIHGTWSVKVADVASLDTGSWLGAAIWYSVPYSATGLARQAHRPVGGRTP